MNKVIFEKAGLYFWDVRKNQENPTLKDTEIVDNICDSLNKKYRNGRGCVYHPQQIHSITVTLTNGKADFQLEKKNTCQCDEVSNRLLDICSTERELYNQTEQKPSAD